MNLGGDSPEFVAPAGIDPRSGKKDRGEFIVNSPRTRLITREVWLRRETSKGRDEATHIRSSDPCRGGVTSNSAEGVVA